MAEALGPTGPEWPGLDVGAGSTGATGATGAAAGTLAPSSVLSPSVRIQDGLHGQMPHLAHATHEVQIVRIPLQAADHNAATVVELAAALLAIMLMFQKGRLALGHVIGLVQNLFQRLEIAWLRLAS